MYGFIKILTVKKFGSILFRKKKSNNTRISLSVLHYLEGSYQNKKGKQKAKGGRRNKNLGVGGRNKIVFIYLYIHYLPVYKLLFISLCISSGGIIT
jgi:hypothetical protein